jgi:hypothetical protein
MSKKQKRQVPTSINPTAPARNATAPTTTTFSRRLATQAEFKPDYTHVISDLKRIGTLAGSFFVILIVLSFVLPLIIK